jgi:RNA 3'-terminal phosphate cyclase (ATP)
VLGRMGARVSARLERWGFFPAGGGAVVLEIEPCPHLTPIEIVERGEILRRWARAAVACLPRSIAEKELSVVREKLGFRPTWLEVQEVAQARSPGNVVSVELSMESHHEVFTAFGERGVPATAVAGELVEDVRRYLASGQPVGEHLADQLLIPFAMAGGGVFRTGAPSRHTLTNVDVVRRFLAVKLECREVAPRAWAIEVGR